MKKLLVWLLSFILFISVFSGCADNNQPSSNQISSNISSSQNSAYSSSDFSLSTSDDTSSILSSDSGDISSDIQSSISNNKNNATANKNPSKKDSADSPSNITNATEQSPQSQAPAASTASSQAPAPIDQPAEQTPDTITVTLNVDCKTAVAQGNDIAQAISQNGYILSGKQITLDTGSTVYDALKKSGLIIGANSSATGTYIYSIQSLAEKACGSKSGWIYYVNGTYINKSCSKYKLNDGDTISWRYTCDNGNDL